MNLRPCLLALVAVFLPLRTADAGLAGARPNIVVVLTDDQGYGDLSCHGSPILRTPNLDRLHAEGARFTDFVVSPTCAPTRASLLAGRHEFKSGVTHTILERERLAPGTRTLPETLKAAGYTTGIFGKWHLGDERDHWPDRRGFDEFFIHGAGGIGQTYEGSCGDAPGNTYFDPAILHNGRFEKTAGYCTDVFFARAQDWMAAQAEKKQPFLCWIATNAPHAPLQVRPEDEARYADKVADAKVAKFYGMIANIDDNVGRLLAFLREKDLERGTLVVFMNDNGGTVGTSVHNAGLRGSKGSPWMGGIKAASFWRWPGKIAPRDLGGLTAHIDVFPTLVELAGAKADETLQKQWDGRSLVPLLESALAPWPDRRVFTHVGRWPRGADVDAWKWAQCSVRTERWHLVNVEQGRKKRWQLFDLSTDPSESRNVSLDHPEVVAELDAAYDEWWTAVRPGMVNETAPVTERNTFKELYWQQFGGGPE